MRQNHKSGWFDTQKCSKVCAGLSQDLTPKQLKIHDFVLSIATIYALVLKHHAIGTHSANCIFIVLVQFHKKNIIFIVKILEISIRLENIYIVVSRLMWIEGQDCVKGSHRIRSPPQGDNVLRALKGFHYHATMNQAWWSNKLQLYHRADSRFAPSQWETGLLCNDVSHWLGASLKSALIPYAVQCHFNMLGFFQHPNNRYPIAQSQLRGIQYHITVDCRYNAIQYCKIFYK